MKEDISEANLLRQNVIFCHEVIISSALPIGYRLAKGYPLKKSYRLHKVSQKVSVHKYIL